jgi:hypothetical protein
VLEGCAHMAEGRVYAYLREGCVHVYVIEGRVHVHVREGCVYEQKGYVGGGVDAQEERERCACARARV